MAQRTICFLRLLSLFAAKLPGIQIDQLLQKATKGTKRRSTSLGADPVSISADQCLLVVKSELLPRVATPRVCSLHGSRTSFTPGAKARVLPRQ